MVVGNPFILIQNFFFGACHNINQIHQGNRKKMAEEFFVSLIYESCKVHRETDKLGHNVLPHMQSITGQHTNYNILNNIYIRIVLSVDLKCNCTKSTKIWTKKKLWHDVQSFIRLKCAWNNNNNKEFIYTPLSGIQSALQLLFFFFKRTTHKYSHTNQWHINTLINILSHERNAQWNTQSHNI